MAQTPDPDWQAFLSGDRNAFERVYRAHGPALLRYGAQFAEAETVQDRTQDLFVRLWERRKRLKADVVVRAYLLVSLRNALFRNKAVVARTTSLEAADPRGASATQEDLLVGQEQLSEQSGNLQRALAALAPRERELVTLRFDQGLDYPEIVELTGLNYQVARNTLSRAIKKLRRHLSIGFFLFAMVTSVTGTYSLLATAWQASA